MNPANPSQATGEIPSPATQGSTAHPLKQHVGKSFRGKKGSATYLRENEYKVIEFVPMFDFGGHGGGKKPAYKFERVGVGSVTTQACVDFLKNFEPWTEAEQEVTEEAGT